MNEKKLEEVLKSLKKMSQALPNSHFKVNTKILLLNKLALKNSKK